MEMESNHSVKTPKALQHSDHPTLISKVRVIVRVRPFLPREITSKSQPPKSCISIVSREHSDEVTVCLDDSETSRKECYQLDSVFGEEDNNVAKIFDQEVENLIPGIFEGHNATVFAYGATGSGKTYTMRGTNQLPGLMPLAMSTILSMSQCKGSKVEISYYEVYMDRCYDLLENKPKEIVIREDKDGHTHLIGLSRVPANSMSEFHELLALATQRRKIAHTDLNDVSSRSHGVLVIGVSTPCCDGSGAAVCGKLNLIDLAGNEDNRRTCNEGIRLQESAKINQSLFSLSNVIYALNNNKPRVPYRESKLTRILQDSLGGTSRALMVACLNPGEYQESVHTVSLAARSRHISNVVSSAQKLDTPKVKLDMEAKLRAWLESKGKTKRAQGIGVFGSPFSVGSMKKPNYQSSAKAKVNSNRCTSYAKERTKAVPFRNLFNTEGLNDSLLESMQSVAGNTIDDTVSNSIGSAVLSTAEFPVERLDKGQKVTFIEPNKSTGESPLNEKKDIVGSPLRKVLTPINSNICFVHEAVSTEQKHVASCGPKTPITPFTVSCANDLFAGAGTPLNKFSAMSASLKSSLVQEYIGLLNTASREELLEINGIGQKMAAYIVDLRETSPLKSLTDLEKLGLSSKQVHNMFSRAARGMFDRLEVPAAPEVVTDFIKIEQRPSPMDH